MVSPEADGGNRLTIGLSKEPPTLSYESEEERREEEESHKRREEYRYTDENDKIK